MSNKIPVALLAATGTVGQKCLGLLENHPRFEIIELVASEKRIGETYADSCNWRESLPCPERIKNLKLISHKDIKSKWVLSALPSDVAREMEKELADKGKIVVSNASAFRMDSDVPLIIPEINKDHLLFTKVLSTSF
jgi:aspartate-semialdehyde dehydrogenase